jgi:hypothetical protein
MVAAIFIQELSDNAMGIMITFGERSGPQINHLPLVAVVKTIFDEVDYGTL